MNRKTNKLFMKNFILLFSLIFMLLALFAFYVYHNSKQILTEELVNYNLQNTEYLSNTFEQEIEDAKHLVSALAINSKISSLMSSPSSPFVLTYYLSDITDMLQSLCYSNKAIETIYIYCESTNEIHRPSFSNEPDDSWIDYLNPDENGFSIFPYTLYGRFPYVICIAKEIEYDGMRSVICCMLNLSNIASLEELSTNENQHFLLVSADEYIIYQINQRDANAPLDASPYLSHYEPSDKQASVLYTENDVPYAFSQLSSVNYPWTYVLCTQLTEYTSRLSVSRAIASALIALSIIISALLALFFSNRALKPIISIKQLLDTPKPFSNNTENSSDEIAYIAKKIISFMQTNQQLAEELDVQVHLLTETRKQNLQLQINPHFLFNTLNLMYMQACDSLGYEHTLPAMIQNLSSLLRYALEPSYMTTFETELHYINVYLDILKKRYGEDITIVQHISPEILDAKVPRLFFQPIIENAVFHGFAKQYEKNCILTISCQPKFEGASDSTPSKLVVTISDNGLGMKQEILKQLQDVVCLKTFNTNDSKHIGLKNVVQRLNLFFADNAQINITSLPNEGTVFTITLPYISEKAAG